MLNSVCGFLPAALFAEETATKKSGEVLTANQAKQARMDVLKQRLGYELDLKKLRERYGPDHPVVADVKRGIEATNSLSELYLEIIPLLSESRDEQKLAEIDDLNKRITAAIKQLALTTSTQTHPSKKMSQSSMF
jgi:hypothetical protein